MEQLVLHKHRTGGQTTATELERPLEHVNVCVCVCECAHSPIPRVVCMGGWVGGGITNFKAL